MADLAHKVPNTAQVKWPAYGATRLFAALAIMKMKDEGRVSVGDLICRFISSCPTDWRRITVKELLTNTSGISYFNPFDPGLTRGATMANCEAMSVLTTPLIADNTWSDCNTFLLEAITAKASGETWEKAMQDLVWRPAGMTSTGLMTNALKPPQVGSFYRAGLPSPALNYNGYYLPYTTVDDLVQLTHALLAGKLISQQSMHAMFAPEMLDYPDQGPTGPRRGYELDMDLATAKTHTVLCLICKFGGGEDDTGYGAGFEVSLQVAPDAGAIQIEVDNDTGYYTYEDNNTLTDYLRTTLYSK